MHAELLESWDRQAKIIDNLFDLLSDDGMPIFEQFAHIHNTRRFWLSKTSHIRLDFPITRGMTTNSMQGRLRSPIFADCDPKIVVTPTVSVVARVNSDRGALRVSNVNEFTHGTHDRNLNQASPAAESKADRPNLRGTLRNLLNQESITQVGSCRRDGTPGHPPIDRGPSPLLSARNS